MWNSGDRVQQAEGTAGGKDTIIYITRNYIILSD